MHWGWQCATPNQLLDAGPGGASKGASPGLGGHLNAIFCLVSGASCVGKRVARVKQGWQCSVVLARDVPGKEWEKREWERNGKGTRSFLSRSSIFGHPFFSRF